MPAVIIAATPLGGGLYEFAVPAGAGCPGSTRYRFEAGIDGGGEGIEAVPPGLEGRVGPDQVEDPPDPGEIGNGPGRRPVDDFRPFDGNPQRFSIQADELGGAVVDIDEDGAGGAP